MLSRRSRFRLVGVALAFAGPLIACATSTGPSTYGSGGNGGSGGIGSVSASAGSQMVIFGGDAGFNGSPNTGSADARAQRCDEAGSCHCFNLASVGHGGATGAQAGKGGTDNTSAFVSYLNNESSNNSVGATQIGCGTDTGCTSAAKPTFDAAFLGNYDVLIFQWMTNSIHAVTMNGQAYGYTGDPGLGGGGYWTFSSAELDAIKTWVNGGGGVIVLSGYDYCPGNPGCTSTDGELGPTNQLLQALSGMSYTATDTFGMIETGNAELCLGDSDPVTGWTATSALGAHITQVGAFHGHGIKTGANSMIDCQTGTSGVCAAHEDIGKGHVYVYTDEWVTYTSQWNPNPQPAGYCVTDGSTSGGDFPAAQVAYQVPQFWYNAISYAAQATMCPFTLPDTIPK